MSMVNLRHDTDRAFNTWDSDYPADMLHLPSGLRISLGAYSNGLHRFTRFPAGSEGLVLGEREIDGAVINVHLEHAGTGMDLCYERAQSGGICGSWRVTESGEWGLRFWCVVSLQFDADSSTTWRLDDDNVLVGTVDDQWVAVVGDKAPLLLTYHDSLDALAGEYESQGYWYLDSRDEVGPLAALRYNLEEMPTLRFAIGLGTSAAQAREQACQALAETAAPTVRQLHEGAHAGALDVVRDVVGWNTVYDTINDRAYTALSRNWSSLKFGGFGVWLDDVLYHGVLANVLDRQTVIDNLRAALAGATEAGNLPCLLTGRDAWIDRSQPPIATFVLWMMHLRWDAPEFLRECYPILKNNHEWWWRERDGNNNGLLEYGTSPVGRGLYRGTKLAAKDESTMDNSPIHDEATLNKESWTLDCEDVALNSIVALDAEMLSNVANAIGETEDAKLLDARGQKLKRQISSELWDESRHIFANRLWSGKFVSSLAPTSFFPMIAGAASAEQARALLEAFHDPKRFGGEFMVPSVTRDDPAYPDNVYWRGRVWPPLNFLVYYGLRRYGFVDEATELAQKSYAMFMAEWSAHRWCAENYNGDTGAARDQPDTDTFYAWGALLPLLAVSEVVDVNPWDGFVINHGTGDLRVGPLQTPFGSTELDSSGGVLTIRVDRETLFRTDLRGRMRIGVFGDTGFELEIAPQAHPTWLQVAKSAQAQVAVALTGAVVEGTEKKGSFTFDLPANARPQSLTVSFHNHEQSQ